MTLDFSHNPADEDSDKLVAVQGVLRRVQAQAIEVASKGKGKGKSKGKSKGTQLNYAELYAKALEEIAVAVGFEPGK